MKSLSLETRIPSQVAEESTGSIARSARLLPSGRGLLCHKLLRDPSAVLGGAMIAEARSYLPDAWWYALAPSLAIFFVVMGFNLLGDALRDILDPRLRRGRR